MKRKRAFDLNEPRKKQNSLPKTLKLFNLLFELLIQFPQALIIMICQYNADPLVFTYEQWEKFDNLVQSEWIEFKRRIEKEPLFYLHSPSCFDLGTKISSSFLFPFTNETGQQNVLLKELIDLEVTCLEWKNNVRTEFMDHIRKTFTEEPLFNFDKTESWWPNPEDKSIPVPDFLKDRIQNQTMADLSPTEITCYYLAWRGDRQIGHVIYRQIPSLFGHYFGYKGILWILCLSSMSTSTTSG